MDLEEKKKQLIEAMRENGCLHSKEIIKAFQSVPREEFVLERDRENAYLDTALSIGFGQTISQPSTIAVMLEMLEAKRGMKVLEIGAGCGYASALLSKVVGAKGKVIGIEYIRELAELAKENLKKTKAKNVEIIHGDGSRGYKREAPYDRILVSCACPLVPDELIEQLADNGTILAPVGSKYAQAFEKITKKNGKISRETTEPGFVFVPLKGEKGF